MSKTQAVVGEVIGAEKIHEFSTGVKVRFKPMSSMIVQRAQEAVPMPPVFQQAVPGPNNSVRIVDNPNHQDYVDRKREAEASRGIKAIEAMILFSVELVNGLPKDNTWLDDLAMVTDLQKYQAVDVDGKVTMSDKAKKLLYVMNVAAVTGDDFGMIATNAVVTEGRVQEEVATF